jgi:hypothetical protein
MRLNGKDIKEASVTLNLICTGNTGRTRVIIWTLSRVVPWYTEWELAVQVGEAVLFDTGHVCLISVTLVRTLLSFYRLLFEEDMLAYGGNFVIHLS